LFLYGQRFTLYCYDNWRWSADRDEARSYQKRSEAILRDCARVLKGQAAFRSETRRIGKRHG
jgi:hypothetical protein